MENFPCGPSKIPILKRKLTETVNAKVDPETLMLNLDCSRPENFEAAPCKSRTLGVFSDAPVSEIDEVISDERKEENLRYLRYDVPFFKDFDDDQFYELMDKVREMMWFGLGMIIYASVTETAFDFLQRPSW